MPVNPNKPDTTLNRVKGPSGFPVLFESELAFQNPAHLNALLAPINASLANLATFANTYPDLSSRFDFLTAQIAKLAVVKVTVANPTARLLLTSAQVQNGDFVSQTTPPVLYTVINDARLSADGVVAGHDDAFLVWDTVGPMGPQGIQGIQGIQGVKGDKGDDALNIDGGSSSSIYSSDDIDGGHS